MGFLVCCSGFLSVAVIKRADQEWWVREGKDFFGLPLWVAASPWGDSGQELKQEGQADTLWRGSLLPHSGAGWTSFLTQLRPPAQGPTCSQWAPHSHSNQGPRKPPIDKPTVWPRQFLRGETPFSGGFRSCHICSENLPTRSVYV